MNIVHIGGFKLGTANGSYNALWNLASAQAKLGHTVTIIRAGKIPSEKDVTEAKKHGVQLIGCVFPRWKYFWTDRQNRIRELIKKLNPNIVHLQYVRHPKFFVISKCLNDLSIPYVVSLHGGMNSTEMKRRKYRKLVYWYLVEARVHKNAAGIHFVTQQEKQDYNKAGFGHKNMQDIVIPNPVLPPETDMRWERKSNLQKVSFVYLGRYDIWTKGLDLALEMMSELINRGVRPEFHLFGSHGGIFEKDMDALLARFSHVPIYDHGFVSGKEKYEAMMTYDFYIQYSRFELFGLSMVEAMSCGVPVLISENCDLSEELVNNNAAIKIPMDPVYAADVIHKALNNKEGIERISKSARKLVGSQFSSPAVAERMEDFYKILISV